MTMHGPYTSNGLELVNTGDFVSDFEADNVIEVCQKLNNNMALLDTVISDVKVLTTKMSILEARGHVIGLTNGGVTGE